MKVLLVNTSDHAGGAAIAALRLLKALRQSGVEATLLCRDRSLSEVRTDVVNLKPSLWLKVKFVLERAEIYAANGFNRKGLFAVDTARYGTDITRLPEFAEADVVHLHWVNQAMLSMKDIERVIQSGKRVVWTMHDMWPFTSICHHATDCESGSLRATIVRYYYVPRLTISVIALSREESCICIESRTHFRWM